MEVMGVLDVPVTWLLLPLALLLLYLYSTWTYSTWTQVGIRGPSPIPILGNLRSFQTEGLNNALVKWKEKYGPVFGMYWSRCPTLVVYDLEILKEIFVKHFSNFSERFVPAKTSNAEFVSQSLFFAHGHSWRRFRNVMTPTFSTGKLKALLGYMDRCARILTEVMEEKADVKEDIDLKTTFDRMTIDVITGTEFGLETNMLRGNDQQQKDLLHSLRLLLSNVDLDSSVQVMTGAFPALGPLFRAVGFTTFPNKSVQFFRSVLLNMVRERDASPAESKHRVDFLQHLLKQREKSPTQGGPDDANDSQTKLYLTEEEVLCQSFIIFLAGFETTANTLRFLTYSLATNPDAQQKVYDEIQDVIGDGEVTYEKLQQLTYLEKAIHETLRMYTPLPVIGRMVAETVTIKDTTMPKGSAIIVPIFNITHDPKHYPQPYSFRPERFGDDQDNFLKVLPFGFGPRQCIGMRLALLEVKVGIVHLLRRVKVVPCDVTPSHITFTNSGLLNPEKPVVIRAERRQ